MTKKTDESFALPPKPDIKEVLTALLNTNSPFPPRLLHRFSDIAPADLSAVKAIWLQVTDNRRQAILEDLEDLVDSDTLTSFEDLARFALTDPLPTVRMPAIRLLWECVDSQLASTLIGILKNDADLQVRATAASALGQYIYYGEMEEIPEKTLHQVEDALLETIYGTDHLEVRRRALEALGFSSRDELTHLVENAYADKDPKWLISALCAMGRSANEKWAEKILNHLNHSNPDVQLEAVRAAGELSIVEARSEILDLLETEDLDFDVRSAAIWSLSQIGGENVRDTLERMMEETDDDEEIEILEDALENLSFTEDMASFDLLDVEDIDPGVDDQIKPPAKKKSSKKK